MFSAKKGESLSSLRIHSNNATVFRFVSFVQTNRPPAHIHNARNKRKKHLWIIESWCACVFFSSSLFYYFILFFFTLNSTVIFKVCFRFSIEIFWRYPFYFFLFHCVYMLCIFKLVPRFFIFGTFRFI